MNRLLYWLTGFLPARLISDGTRPYLERYYVGTLFGWRFYLHRFVGSDPDLGLHDHPWRRAFSIVLSGWYREQRRDGMRIVRWFNTLTGDTFHYIVLPNEGKRTPSGELIELPCWTLFFHRVGNVKSWGYLRDSQELGARFLGKQHFIPHTYEREGSQKDWWLKAPKGRCIQRKAEHGQ